MTSPHSRRLAVVGALAAAALLLSGCSGTAGSSGDTVTAGKLTIATGQPAYSPWVDDDDPESGKGFEAAVAYAVAKKMGYAKSDVVWTRTTFDGAIAPGPKDFDLNIQQFSVTAKRKKAVDFSAPYYTTTQAVVTVEGSKAEGATTLAALKDVTIGVAAGTTTREVVEQQVGVSPRVFNSNDDAVLALKSGQVDAIAVDLPTAFYLADAELKKGTVLGQFAGNAGGDEFAFVLPKDSPLTAKASKAVRALRSDGMLATLTTTWLSTAVDVPTLK